MSTEVDEKLALIRTILAEEGLAAVRLRGVDWFAWATAGGSNAVALGAETGVAEVLVTPEGAWVLTDPIEADRLAQEEVPEFRLHVSPWARPVLREEFVAAKGSPVASDRPRWDEQPLPAALVIARQSLGTDERRRYRALGREAEEAVEAALRTARPEHAERALAAEAARALWSVGIQPMVLLVGGEARLPIHRHPTPSARAIGGRAMLVVCGRRHGLYANLTRFMYFRDPTVRERAAHETVAAVEAVALAHSRPGAVLGEIFNAIAAAYVAREYAAEETRHHQGGTCGYLSRDVLATPTSTVRLQPGNAVAWNPSVSGAKIEDTVLLGADGHEALTCAAGLASAWRGVRFG